MSFLSIYVFTVPLLLDFISTLYRTLFAKHFPSSGHSFTLWQLHGSGGGEPFGNSLWLCLEIVDLMFSIHES
jgi:hypothetical protein